MVCNNLTIEISPSLVGVEDIENELIIYTQEKSIVIDSGSNWFSELTIFNLEGKKITHKKINKTSSYTLKTKLETGVYIIKIKLNK